MKDRLKSRKGFTLVELLIAITILGIIMAIAIPALTSISRKDIDTQKRIYEDALITAAKMYNDSYSEDTFGRSKYGCAKIPYSKLKDKDLIKNLESNQLDCAYKEKVNGEDQDTSGLIVRKINNNYYYETILWCKNKSTDKVEKASGNTNDKFYEIEDAYCDETATEDNNPPEVYYTNNNHRYYYSKDNLPKPTVWVYDAVSGLQPGSVTLNIEWRNLQSNTIIDRGTGTNRYTISRAGTNLAPQPLTLINEITNATGNGKYQIKVTSKNVVDGAGRSLPANTSAKVAQPSSNSISKPVTHPDIFYMENTLPKITATASSTWKNTTIPVTLSVTDEDTNANNVYSGIKTFTRKVVNNSDSNKVIDNNVNCGEVSTETQIQSPRNATQKSKSCSFTIGTGNYKDGSYTVTTKATDWAGNVSTSSNSYQYDGTSPTVAITRTAYNQYKWTASDTGYSGLNGFVNDKNSANPSTGWQAKASSGTVSVGTAGTYYTHVRDTAGNQGRASIAAYTVTRSVGAGTTLTTKFENSSGTAFTNNPVVFNGTPVYSTATLQAGYENLKIMYGSTTISAGTVKNVTANVTISTSATKCAAGKWNNGSYGQCQSCPAGYTSDVGATAQTSCYINVPAAKYKKTPTGTDTASCANGYYKVAHKSYYNSADSCTACPAGYQNGGPATAESNCIKSVPAGQKVATARGAATGCGNGYYRAAHTVNYGGTSSCTACPAGYQNGAAAAAQSGCVKNVPAGQRVATAGGGATGCGNGYYRAAHTVAYGSTSSCTACPAGYQNGAAAAAQSGCVKSVPAGQRVATPGGAATGCGNGYYKAAHTVAYGSTSSCTGCPSGYQNGSAAAAQSGCMKSVPCGSYVASAGGGTTTCPAGTYKVAHSVAYGSTSSCTGCGSGKTSNAGSCASTNCRNACSAPVSSQSTGDCGGCQKGGYWWTTYCQFNFSDCTSGLSGHMCYYNPWGSQDCSVGRRSNSSGDGNTGTGYAEFSGTTWRYYRYTECVEMDATSTGNGWTQRICCP